MQLTLKKFQKKNERDKAGVVNVNIWGIWENGNFLFYFYSFSRSLK